MLIVGGVVLFFPDIFSVQDKDSFYVEEVKPIINKKCISCHGGVKQSAGFSMMNRASFFKKMIPENPLLIFQSPLKVSFWLV